jgi:NADH-quinone oxidoreductase subunit H
VFFTCATASCKRAPFDLAEAESELVAGFHTEYSGLRWSFFFMAEYGSMFAVSGLATLLFLGGWHLGFLPFELSDKLYAISGGQTWLWVAGNVINVLVFIVKGWLLVFVMMWVRWTLPRLRIDQVMMTCLRYLLPLSCILLVGVSVWQLAACQWEWLDYTRFVLGILCLVLFIWLIVMAIRSFGTPPTELMPGAWRGGYPATPVGAGKT